MIISKVYFFTDAVVRNLRNYTCVFYAKFFTDTQGTSESNYPFDSASMKDLNDVFKEIKGRSFSPLYMCVQIQT